MRELPKLPWPNSEVIARKPYSAHPGDSHLEVVLVDLKDGHPERYVVWYLNHDDGGYGCGQYTNVLHNALCHFNSRGQGHTLQEV